MKTLGVLAFTLICFVGSVGLAGEKRPKSDVVSGYIVKRGNEYRWMNSPRAFQPGLRIRFKPSVNIGRQICVFTEYRPCHSQLFKIGKVVQDKSGYILIDVEPTSEVTDAKVDQLLSLFK